MNSCTGLFGKIFGHKYVTAYNTEQKGEFISDQHKLDLVGRIVNQLVKAIRPPYRKQTVAAIYCTRCGNLLDHSKKNRNQQITE